MGNIFSRELITGAAWKPITAAGTSAAPGCSENARSATNRRWSIWSRPPFGFIHHLRLLPEPSRRTLRSIDLILMKTGAVECGLCGSTESMREGFHEKESRDP